MRPWSRHRSVIPFLALPTAAPFPGDRFAIPASDPLQGVLDRVDLVFDDRERRHTTRRNNRWTTCC